MLSTMLYSARAAEKSLAAFGVFTVLWQRPSPPCWCVQSPYCSYWSVSASPSIIAQGSQHAGRNLPHQLQLVLGMR